MDCLRKTLLKDPLIIYVLYSPILKCLTFKVSMYRFTFIIFAGGIALVWYLFWINTVSNDPATDKSITEAEKSYLREAIKNMEPEKVII